MMRKHPDPLPPAPDLSFERALWAQGIEYVAGIDEAGRGALAGPVTAAAIIFAPDPGLLGHLVGVRDSKQMRPKARADWSDCLKTLALAWGVGYASNQEIDTMGILPATRLAVCRALECMAVSPQHMLVDYLNLPEVETPQTVLVKGDRRSMSIAAASILAKTARDALLCTLHETYPDYGFARHKGYGTQIHRAALESLGPCSVHRLSFAPIKAKVKIE